MFPERLPELLQRSGFKEYILKIKFLSTNRFTCLLYEKYPVCKHNFKKKFKTALGKLKIVNILKKHNPPKKLDLVLKTRKKTLFKFLFSKKITLSNILCTVHCTVPDQHDIRSTGSGGSPVLQGRSNRCWWT